MKQNIKDENISFIITLNPNIKNVFRTVFVTARQKIMYACLINFKFSLNKIFFFFLLLYKLMLFNMLVQ